MNGQLGAVPDFGHGNRRIKFGNCGVGSQGFTYESFAVGDVARYDFNHIVPDTGDGVTFLNFGIRY